ncbi:MAG TPA: Uma2 family endonuclease [Pyrinomonadaceae bacterium]|nr:Uma2 family endonuclease [Pyrinomonadaceae bacterium]
MSEKILTQTDKIYTVEDYLKFKHRGSNKREFFNGKIMDTAGSSRGHNLIGSNTTIAIGSRLRGHKCEIYVNDMLVKMTDKSFCYPDVVVVKDEPIFEGTESDILVNPTVVVEVASKATLCHDKTVKLDSYLAMETVRECLLIKEDEMRVEHYSKQTANQWVYKIYNRRDDNISLDSINCRVSVAEIYSQINFA